MIVIDASYVNIKEAKIMEKNHEIKKAGNGAVRIKDVANTYGEDIWYIVSKQNKLKLMYGARGCKI